jgi:hypothetical protein
MSAALFLIQIGQKNDPGWSFTLPRARSTLHFIEGFRRVRRCLLSKDEGYLRGNGH